MRFSSRICWTLEQNRVAQHLERFPARLDLTQSNPTAAGIVYPREEIAAALADARALRYEPSPAGLPAAREAVSAYYGGAVPPERILLTASTSEAYAYLFKLLCDPADEVLVPRPSYPLFEFLAHLEGAAVRQYPMHYHGGWYVDVEALADAVSPRTRVIVFVNPNNPTGSFLKPHELDRMAALRLPLILDEVFADYAFGPPPPPARRPDVLTFTLSGLSKVAGLPQMKLGWIALSGPDAEVRDALERLELIADTFLSVGSPVQQAAPALLRVRGAIQEQIRERTRRNLDHLRTRLASTAAEVLDVEAGWYATLRVPRTRTEEEWVLALLENHGVLAQPGFFFDFDPGAHLVVSLLTAPEIFDAGVEALAREAG